MCLVRLSLETSSHRGGVLLGFRCAERKGGVIFNNVLSIEMQVLDANGETAVLGSIYEQEERSRMG